MVSMFAICPGCVGSSSPLTPPGEQQIGVDAIALRQWVAQGRTGYREVGSAGDGTNCLIK